MSRLYVIHLIKVTNIEIQIKIKNRNLVNLSMVFYILKSIKRMKSFLSKKKKVQILIKMNYDSSASLFWQMRRLSFCLLNMYISVTHITQLHVYRYCYHDTEKSSRI